MFDRKQVAVFFVTMMAAVAVFTSPAYGEGDLVVSHGVAPAPVYLDNGEKGESVGDVRIWHFEGTTGEGASVVMEWIMTTTGLDTAGEGAESRVTLGVFSFTGFDEDQILLQGIGLYPNTSNTFKPNSRLTRAIIGGTGKYKGACGEVLSVHKDDGSWEHTFKFSND